MRHHYIPQWLLRYFRDSNGKIHGFVKSDPAGGVFTTTSKKLMVKKDFYTLLGGSWPDRQAAEKEYSRREALMKPVADKIIFAARIFRVERARQSLVNLFERGRVVRDGELAMWEVRWWPAYEGTIGGMPAVDRAVSARAAVAVDR